MKRKPLDVVVRRRFARRDLLKAAPIAAAAAGIGAYALKGARSAERTQRRGTCRFCLMHCGIVTTLEGRRLEKVEGDLRSRTKGFVCEHGYALRELVSSAERLRHPLIRRKDAFVEVSFEEAFEEIGQRLLRIRDEHGAQSLVLQSGWPFVRHPIVPFFHRFAQAFGSPNVATVSSLCEASLRMGQALTVGSKYAPEVRAARTMVVWGANPWVTAPPFAHVVANRADRGNLIVIDPVRTNLAKMATTHLQIRPGTDGALALGLINLIIANDTFDSSFVETQTVGFEELRRLAADYPLERVAALTSLKAADIQRVAQAMAKEGPTRVWAGLGVEHHENGVQTIRAISSLEALVGRFSGQTRDSFVSPVTPHFAEEMLPALYRMTTPEPVPPPVPHHPLGYDAYPAFTIYNREAQGELIADAILDEKPYPVRALILWGSNALVTSSGSQRLAKAISELDLLVTIDPFLNASGRRSDVVLAASTFAESADISDRDEAAVEGLVPVEAGSLPDWDILRGLAGAVGLGHFFPWRSLREALNARHVPFMADAKLELRPHTMASAPQFGTPSGKVEFQSEVLASLGLETLPTWSAPTLQQTETYPLRLVTGPRPRARINSQFAQSPAIKARMGENEALVHPTVAQPLGLTTGELIEVRSPVGSIHITCVVTDDVHPECVVMAAGWAEANANELIDGSQRDPISGFPAFRSSVCRIQRAQRPR